jgi:uncharacterized ferritin-like protein (DUF455 family)
MTAPTRAESVPQLTPGQRYAQQLLAVIQLETCEQKALALADLLPPEDGCAWDIPVAPRQPGRPGHWIISETSPKRRRSLHDLGARRIFLHAIYHIELSAIDLAVLLCLRAPGSPRRLHQEFLGIAREEAVHAQLLEGWLTANDAPPGSHSVHHRLWDTAVACADLGEQLVVVPRYLEARGLDVSAELLPRLREADAAAGAILSRIYQDELTHVAIGSRWHDWWCERLGLERARHFGAVVRRRFPSQLPSPFRLDLPGRLQAGFSAAELAVLGAGAPPPAPE